MTAVCKHIDVFIFYVFCVYFISAEQIYRYSVPVNDSIFLPCCQELNQIQWQFQEDMLFLGGFLMLDDFSTSLSLQRNGSLYIYLISLLHIGKYECIKNEEKLSTYFIDVEGLYMTDILICSRL